MWFEGRVGFGGSGSGKLGGNVTTWTCSQSSYSISVCLLDFGLQKKQVELCEHGIRFSHTGFSGVRESSVLRSSCIVDQAGTDIYGAQGQTQPMHALS